MIQFVVKKLFRLREQAAMRPGADDGFDPHEKPFLDHLDDLRVTLFRIIGTLVIATCVAFIFNKEIFQLVQLPAKSHFADVAEGVSLYDKLELTPLAPTEMIFLMFKLAFYVGLILTFPFVVFFLFQFLMPGLRQVEKRTIIPGVAAGFILFLLGGSFAFFLATPFALKYFYQFENERLTATDPANEALARPASEIALIGVEGTRIPPVKKGEKFESTSKLSPEMRNEIRTYLLETLTTAEGSNFALRYDNVRDKIALVPAKGGKSVYRIGYYISFVSQLVLVFGISFQMPIVVTILVKLQLLTARVMRNTRSYAWIIIIVLAAILTPSPDAFTMALLGVPLILLYEICIIVASIIEKSREKRERAQEAAEKLRLEALYRKPTSELSEEEKAELHRAEIEQYEKDHPGLIAEESDHVSRDTLHGEPTEEDSPHSESSNYDESWHESTSESHTAFDSDHVELENLDPGESESRTDSEFENCVPDGPVVDLNHASWDELQTLPGIDSYMAQLIIDHRPFETYDDLYNVPGLDGGTIQGFIERSMLG